MNFADDGPPQFRLMQMLSAGWIAQSISVAATLGVADHLAGGPRTSEDLAAAVGAHAPSLYRLLRALSSVGVFNMEADGRFSLTPLSECLRGDTLGSLRPLARFEGLPGRKLAWASLDYSVCTGKSAFEHVHGMTGFEYLKAHPEFIPLFTEALRANSAVASMAVAMSYDFSGAGTLVDVGGAQGALMQVVLTSNPSLKGVVFDMPEVIDTARQALAEAGFSDRCQCVGGDFFESVPAGDTHILSHILHDWDDATSRRILENVRKASAPGKKLLVAEMIVPEGNEPSFSKLVDLEMLVSTTGGRERTEAQYRELLGSSGYSMTRVVPTFAPVSVIEAVAV
jgi:predicted O-methyltransferase YrrM